MMTSYKPTTSEGPTHESTRRLMFKRLTLYDTYTSPTNYLKIGTVNPITRGVPRNRYTDYEVRLKVRK